MGKKIKQKRTGRSILSILLILCISILFSGCERIVDMGIEMGLGTIKMDYADSEKYSAGDARLRDEIDEILIEWINGDVDIRYYDGDKVSISETATKEGEEISADELQKEDLQLRYYVDGSVLQIHFLREGTFKELKLSKKLTVLLPETYKLKLIDFDGVDSDLTLSDLTVKQIKGEMVDGNLSLQKVVAKEIDLDSVDGDLHIDDGTSLERLDVDTVDGDVELYLPGNGDFIAEMDSVGGKFTSEFDVKVDDETYSCGNGGRKLDFDTVDGDVTIHKMK
ncbi:MAG: DUF4097 domain-containing protein [Firmicutes bacterium]|jgi:DUF4097 and DUF4098 domain-containing protein YvlB|nr:DUF4097 domain-containing protein [Bacillota bacterium]